MISVSLAEALAWTERLTALALGLQTAELLLARRAFSEQGVWRWSVLRAEHAELPPLLRWLLAPFMPYPAFVGLLVARLPLALGLAFGEAWSAPPLLLSQLVISARFRGSFNGGSDSMTVVLLLALSLASTAPALTPAALAYVCVQLVLSYFIAGTVKLVRAEWRSGRALWQLVSSDRYGTPLLLRQSLRRPLVARLATWSVLSFECAFPASLVGPHVALPFLLLGTGFHVANVALFGLNRFLFAWLAAYPALLHFSAALENSFRYG